MAEQLTEAGTVVGSPTSTGGGRYRVLCISEGKGSSGVYPRETLQEAARNKVIPAGTFAYLDHPSATEATDRPERSVRDLAGVFTSDAEWSDEHNGLVAEMRVFAPYQPLISEMADVIGLSIRGDGEIEMREGQRTVTNLAHVQSVDWVTRAGRGGKVLELLESARPTRTHLAEARNIGQWVESAIHRDFTVMADDMAANGQLSREERITLSGAIGDALAAFVSNLEANAPQLYQRDLWDEPTAPAVSEGAPAPTTAPTEKEGLVPELTEAEVTALRDTATQAEAARDAALAEAEAARSELAGLRRTDAARPVIAALLAESAVISHNAATQARLTREALRDVPATDSGDLDEAALRARVTEARTEAEAELAAVLTEAGRPRGLGDTHQQVLESGDEPDEYTALFGQKG